MAILPRSPRGLWDDFAPIFTRSTFCRSLILVGSAILAFGRCTIADRLRTAGSLADGASSIDRRNPVIHRRTEGENLVKHDLDSGPVLTLVGTHREHWKFQDGQVRIGDRVAPVVCMYDRDPE